MHMPNQYSQPYPMGQNNQSTKNQITIASLNVKNPLITQLKKVLDQKISKYNPDRILLESQSVSNQAFYPIIKQKIFAPPSKAYFILNSLYQSFKKKNQFKLLQEKVHKIDVYHANHQIQQQSKAFHLDQKTHKSRVTPHIMFSSHQQQLSGAQIIKFIEMQEFIKPGVKNELLNQILKSISNLKDIKQIMKCYQKLFSTKYCSQNLQLKEIVEEKMIKKILSIDFSSNSSGIKQNIFNEIGKSLLGFPSISQNILYFIGLLFDKVEQNLSDYDFLYKIMRNNFTFKLDNLQQTIQNIKFKKQIEALIKVNNKQNSDLIKSLLRSYIKLKEKNPDLDDKKVINVLKIAQTQVKYKLIKISSIYQNIQIPISPAIIDQNMELVQQEIKKQEQFTQKTLYTLKFITEVIKSGSNLWKQTNKWLKCTKSQKSKQFLLNEITIYLEKCLNDEKKIKNAVIPHLKIIYNEIQETSQIYRLWLKQFIKPSTTPSALKQKYLKFRLLKKFIIKGIIDSSNLSLFADIIFSASLNHADIFIDIFVIEKEKSFAFFKEIIQNEIYSKLFYSFLVTLRQKKPVKFKEWFVFADQLRGGDLFLCGRNSLTQFVKNNMKIQIAFNWIRDLAMYPPSKFFVWNLINIMALSKQKKQYPALRNCIARTLNLILIRTPVNKLSDEFKKHLPSLAQQLKDFKQDYDIIFADVSQQTTNQLKRKHMQSLTPKF